MNKGGPDHEIDRGLVFMCLCLGLALAIYLALKLPSEEEPPEAAPTNAVDETGIEDAFTGETDEQALAEYRAQPATPEAEQLPILTRNWLVGTWGPAEHNPANDPTSSCDTDNIIKFAGDGTYTDGGAKGRYDTDGRVIRYFDRQSYDPFGQQTDSTSMETVTAAARVVDANTFQEDGALWRRCVSDIGPPEAFR